MYRPFAALQRLPVRVIEPKKDQQPLLSRIEMTGEACPAPPAVLEGIAKLLEEKFGDTESRPVDGTWTLNTQYSNHVVRYKGQHCRRCPHSAARKIEQRRCGQTTLRSSCR